jgi:hypothetical protein
VISKELEYARFLRADGTFDLEKATLAGVRYYGRTILGAARTLGCDVDDLAQACKIRLYKYLARYDPTKTQLQRFIWHNIAQTIWYAMNNIGAMTKMQFTKPIVTVINGDGQRQRTRSAAPVTLSHELLASQATRSVYKEGTFVSNSCSSWQEDVDTKLLVDTLNVTADMKQILHRIIDGYKPTRDERRKLKKVEELRLALQGSAA